jgi:Glycosyltransferases involved in cell wall biogenesis
MPKVTIVMPSLNVAPFIRECIDSVVAQTLEDIEILCIDAGSTDGTLEILQDYAASDSRIRIINSDKKSYGYQMNLGFCIAKGEYIGIVETDDYVESNMFEKLYEVAADNDADFVKSNFYLFADMPGTGRITLEHKLYGSKTDEIISKRVSYADYVKQTVPFDIFMWNGIYRRDFVLKNNIRLNETPGAAYQDAGFRCQIAFLVQKGVFIPSLFYHYRRDNAGSSMYSPKRMQYNFQECHYMINWAERTFSEGDARLRAVCREIFIIFITALENTSLKNNFEKDPAVTGYCGIVKEQFEKGRFVQNDFFAYMWYDLCLLTEFPETFWPQMKFRSEHIFNFYRDFLSSMKAQKEVVIFGCGKYGKKVHCLLSMNGVSNIVCFCDNNPNLWESTYMRRKILSPQQAVKSHPDAFFLITNQANGTDILKQLISLNVPIDNTMFYRLSVDPFICTGRYLD